MSEQRTLVCPECGGAIQELATRATSQPVFGVLFAAGSEDPDDLDWDEFDYGDDVDVTGYECRSDYNHAWNTLDELRAALFSKPEEPEEEDE